MESRIFADRSEAGKKLAKAFAEYKNRKTLVFALPRGGVPIGYEIARALDASLDTIVARKIGAPGNPEYAIGAIAPGAGGGTITMVDATGVESVVESETREMHRRMEKYGSGSYSREVEPEVVIVVDDGVATGRTAIVALRSARVQYGKAKLVFAAPVGAPDSITKIKRYADEVVVLEAPPEFMAVGEWYASFPQLSDAEVVEYLEKARVFTVPKH